MGMKKEVLVINKQELIRAALEMERQEILQACLLFHCLDQLEDIHRKLNLILPGSRTSSARNAFFSLVMDDCEWKKIITEQKSAD